MYDSNDDDETTTDDDEGEEEARSAMGGGASGIRVLLGAAAASTAASAIGVKRERLSPTVGEAPQSVGTAAASEAGTVEKPADKKPKTTVAKI